MQLTDLLHRQRELLLAAPVLPGGRFDPSLHPPRYPWRHAFLGALFTALAVALTWCVSARLTLASANLYRHGVHLKSSKHTRTSAGNRRFRDPSCGTLEVMYDT